MAGVCDGDPANVTVDGDGYLHLRISQAGSNWSAAELFSPDRLGFGTYQWQIDGPIDRFDPNVVLGLFPYGPKAGIGKDGTNEIDIEYSRWGDAAGPNADYTDYPATGSTVGELSYTFSLTGSLSTSRFVWTTSSITDFLFDGLSPISGGGTPRKTWTYMPAQPTTNIPQQPLPLGMNLWCFDAPPSDGNPVEIVIRDFQFLAEGDAIGTGGNGSSEAGAAGANSELGGRGSLATAGSTSAGGISASAGGHGGAGAGGNAGTSAAGASTGGRSETGGTPGDGRGGQAGAYAAGGAAGASTAGGAAGASPSRGGAAGTRSGARGGAGAGSSRAAGCGCRVLRDGDEKTQSGAWVLLLVLVARRRARWLDLARKHALSALRTRR
jgi:hypothetical protein